jgi:hypothetical protein
MPFERNYRFGFLLPINTKRDGRFIHVENLEIQGIASEDGNKIDAIIYKGANVIGLIDYLEKQCQTPLYKEIIKAMENHLSDPVQKQHYQFSNY